MTIQPAPVRAATTPKPSWPTPRAPRWLIAAVAAVAAGTVLGGLAHRPTNGQRGADLDGVIQTLNSDIESCAGGLRDSLSALQAIQSGTSRDVPTAISIARDGATNCSPANNEQLDDLVQYQVPESLARFRLPATVDNLLTWAFPWAQRVQSDIAAVLSAPGRQARETASAALFADRRQLDAQRGEVDGALSAAARSLGSTDLSLSLPS
ncbi:MAG TPA: hypothetical protein VLW50_23685 [Streptosporangiaceae bacterium]|nr:hypothetical protein [Streptosporangiaceae bacterium]